jgi:hypothetical protein
LVSTSLILTSSGATARSRRGARAARSSPGPSPDGPRLSGRGPCGADRCQRQDLDPRSHRALGHGIGVEPLGAAHGPRGPERRRRSCTNKGSRSRCTSVGLPTSGGASTASGASPASSVNWLLMHVTMGSAPCGVLSGSGNPGHRNGS